MKSNIAYYKSHAKLLTLIFFNMFVVFFVDVDIIRTINTVRFLFHFTRYTIHWKLNTILSTLVSLWSCVVTTKPVCELTTGLRERAKRYEPVCVGYRGLRLRVARREDIKRAASPGACVGSRGSRAPPRRRSLPSTAFGIDQSQSRIDPPYHLSQSRKSQLQTRSF